MNSLNVKSQMRKNLKNNWAMIIAVVLGSVNMTAQQNSLFNTYAYDPFQLNVAYAGHGCIEANVHYRSQWIGMKDAPKMFQLNAHTALGKSNALGVRLISQQQGLLNTTQATVGYAYRFKVSETADMHLGLGIGWTQNVLNAQKAVVIDASDVTLSSAGKQKANGFDSEVGAMYLGQKLKAGIAVAHLYNSNPSFTGSNYKLLPQSNISLSYLFNKDKKVELEPWLVDRYTINGSHAVEGLVNVHFVKAFTVGAGYRSNYGILGFLGVKVGGLKIAYSFDYGTSKNATATGSSHQILLGFSTCKKAKAVEKVEEPVMAVTPTPATEPAKEEPVQEVKKEEPLVVKEAPKEEIKQPVVKEMKEEVKEDVLPKMNDFAEEVVFPFGKAKLDREGLDKLDEIAKLMKQNPELKINIIGHTCNKGDEEFNKNLSKQRADYVKKQLVKRNVNPKNINQIIGVGEENELFNNNDPDTKRKNRTVRFELAK